MVLNFDMKIFSYLYALVIEWSKHRYAPYCLAGVAFTESAFFPIPPDVMLISMGLASPKRVGYYALLTTVCSVIGGLFGYLIGLTLIDMILPYIESLGYLPQYLKIVGWFKEWGVSVVFLAGFSPIPYKLFTISAGALHMALLPFLVVSLVSRGLRFYLVAWLLKVNGEGLDKKLRLYIDYIGWLLVLIFVIVYLVAVCFF